MSSQPEYAYMIGLTLDAAVTPEQAAAFQIWYDADHVPDVLAANAGFGAPSRYHLEAAPGGDAPEWLAVYPVDSLDAAQAYIERQFGGGSPGGYPAGPVPWEQVGIVWRAMWRVASSRPASGAVSGMLLAGITPPPDLDAAGLAEFDDFYDNGHVVDILKYGNYSAYTRYELLKALPAAVSEYPHYCTVYTAGADAAEFDAQGALAKAGMGGLLSPGPDVWQRRSSTWRAWWRPAGNS